MLIIVVMAPGGRCCEYRFITEPVAEQKTVYWRLVERKVLPLHETLTDVAVTGVMLTNSGFSEEAEH